MVVNMTKQEFILKYGKVLVSFERYSKCVFTFSTVCENNINIFIGVGGCHENIYGIEICKDSYETIENLDPFSGFIYCNGVLIDSFYD